MYQVSATFLSALRSSHTVAVRVDAYSGTSLLASDLEVAAGAVTIGSGAGVRRTLDVTLADTSLWATLDTPGIELRVQRGIRYPDGRAELVPLGTFVLDQMSMRLAPGGGLQVRSAPDKWVYVQRAQFETPRGSTAGLTIRQQATTLVLQALPTTPVTIVQLTDATLVSRLVWDRDRSAAALDLIDSIGGEIFFDADGDLTVRPVPAVTGAPVWTVDASPTGVLIDGDRARDRSRAYNVVVASMSAVDGRTPFAPQTAADTDPTSPTYVGGPMGRVPHFYSSPSLRNTTQALAAATAKLQILRAPNAQVSLTSAVNPALDRWDVIDVYTPDGVHERHQVDTATIPLDVGGTQQITTRSSSPED